METMETTTHEDMRVVGSAEPLSAEETQQRLRELAAWGVDLSLVQMALERSPTERIEHMLGLLEFAEALHDGYSQRRASSAEQSAQEQQ